MSRKAIIAVLLANVFIASFVYAYNADYYITTGRTQMFDGTLSGVRAAYQTFSAGLTDGSCSGCAESRELKFLHSVSGTIVLLVRDDGGSVNSFFELGRKFGLNPTGDYWAPYFYPVQLNLDVLLNQHGIYEIPAAAPDKAQIKAIINTVIIPQIDSLIAELNSISDAPGDHFKIFLNPNEVRIFFDPNSPVFDPGSPDYDPGSRFLQPLEVDYGEVLLLKGFLVAFRSLLTEQLPYDTYTDPNDLILQKIANDCFNMNTDLLEPYPHFGKVLPTVNDSNSGDAILTQISYDINSVITCYLQAVDYISNEDVPPGTDPQDNEFLYIDPNNKKLIDTIKDRLTALRLSLADDTVGTYPVQTTKKYVLEMPASGTTWELIFDYDLMNRFTDEGSFTASDNNYPSPWKITDMSADGPEITIDMEYDRPYQWGGATFTGVLSSDENAITDGTFTYWGPSYGTIDNMSGLLVDTIVVNQQLDVNPVFGSSGRYPNPVNLRDLLPQFNYWNDGVPGTMGSNLGNDAALGGILPLVTQDDWQKFLNLQPGGLFYLQEIYPWQLDTYTGYPDFWLNNQLVFEDPVMDTWDDVGAVDNVDVSRLYLTYGDDYLYGLIALHDFNAVNDDYLYYDLKLSYSPDDEDSRHSIWLRMRWDAYSTYIYGEIYYMNDYYGYQYWQYVNSFDARKGVSGIEFRIAWWALPDMIPGRFISLSTEGYDSNWYNLNGEDNPTHKQIQRVGTISGAVTCNGFAGAPIFIQAYTDRRDPEGSMVTSTVLSAPGPYMLTGIGLGWQGYVGAHSPLFGSSIFALDALNVEDSTSVVQWSDDIDGINLVLNVPEILHAGNCSSGYTDPNKTRWYGFDAVVGGIYTIDLSRGTSNYAYLTLFDRDGDSELVKLYYWDYQQIIWSPPVDGRYYVKVAEGYDSEVGGSFDICLTSCLGASTDIASPDGWGLKDCEIDFYDLEILISHWLDGCSDPSWCDGADFDLNGSVDFRDYSKMAGEW